MHDTIESEADSRHESEAMTATEYAQLDAKPDGHDTLRPWAPGTKTTTRPTA